MPGELGRRLAYCSKSWPETGAGLGSLVGAQGQFPNTAACSNPFIDIKFYAGTQAGLAF